MISVEVEKNKVQSVLEVEISHFPVNILEALRQEEDGRVRSS